MIQLKNRQLFARLLVLLVLAWACTGLVLAQQNSGQTGGGDTAKEPAATGQSTAGTDAGTAKDEHPESWWDFVVFGGLLMYPIGICSLLWLTFLGERLIYLRPSKIAPAVFTRQIEQLEPGKLDRDGVVALCEANPGSAARVIHTAVEHIGETREEIELAVNNTAQREIHLMRRYIRVFAVIAAVAPLLGLLGTVMGMIQAFREVAVMGLGGGKALAPGIYKALVTTAAGLVVAIPTLMTHYWMMSRVEGFVHRIDNLVVDFVEKFRGGKTKPARKKKAAKK
ncbi:MAG: MotA/TolQ/ExbB proton channel family protein [Planctomycetota bacterium]|nr:MotA/TolQ/ExbB proton channel family protein [Planctomycetota bacterium]